MTQYCSQVTNSQVTLESPLFESKSESPKECPSRVRVIITCVRVRVQVGASMYMSSPSHRGGENSRVRVQVIVRENSRVRVQVIVREN
ncbi:hypothetical protein CesoFtcFv8_001915 [Champsocephalus esox]|uniref:Uncharacterized protein n=1 Tax=Champsocephalus esox TaxID=159716 RepID=A0AAN8CWW3_9TELE|nr:hypothetical protein CesoFtcFv8_001915 [Champsocephalus esox]